MSNQRKFVVVFIILIGLIVSLRIYPAFTLPLFGDEGDDLYIIVNDASSLKHFFSDKHTYAWDQARFPHLISAIAMVITGINADNIFKRLGIIRFVFLLMHIGYLIISYKLIASITQNRTAPFIYVFLLTTSCYMASFSTAMMTSGDTAFMFFHILSIKIFYDNFKHAVENNGLFQNFLLLSLIIALCIASKLFGVLLLISFFLFHLCNLRNMSTIQIASVHPKEILFKSLLFLLAVGYINIIPVPLLAKSLLAISVGIIYLGIMIQLIIRESKKEYEPIKINFILFWALLSFVSFTFVLVFSPIYLNLKNLLNVFGWFGTWNIGAVAPDSKYYDALMIIIIKFGIIPCMLLLFTTAANIYFCIKYVISNPSEFINSLFMLLLIIFLFHLILICLIQFKLVWHSLAVFPFLYLPFVGLWILLQNKKKELLQFILIIAVLGVSVDNLYRYFSWYPYGHLDGGQYGEKYIGINKPCFVTFESIPIFFDYIKDKVENDNANIKQINVRGCSARILNNYLGRMLVKYFENKGLGNIKFVNKELQTNGSDWVITSPIYNPEFEKLLLYNNYKKIKSLSISGVVVGTVWSRD